MEKLILTSVKFPGCSTSATTTGLKRRESDAVVGMRTMRSMAIRMSINTKIYQSLITWKGGREGL